MCGLVGFVRTKTVNKTTSPSTYNLLKQIIPDLLYVDTLRGQDSTGMVWVNKDGVPILYKDTIPGTHFVKSEKVKNMINQIENHQVVIGHNRHATMGNHTVESAHPFRNKHIIGAHNGTLRNETQWNNVLPAASPGNLDSARLMAGIANMPLDDIFSKVSGAYALTWLDLQNQTINILRNSERPLFLCYNEEHGILFWSSEKEILLFCLNRSNMDHEWYYSVPVNRHFSLNYGVDIEVPKEPKEVGQWFDDNSTKIKEYAYSSFYQGGVQTGGTRPTTTTITSAGNHGGGKPKQLAGPLPANKSAVFLTEHHLKPGDLIRVTVGSFHNHVTTDKQGNAKQSVYGILTGNYKGTYGNGFKDVSVMMLSVKEDNLQNNKWQDLTEFTAEVKAGMQVKHPTTGEEMLAVLCENRIKNPIYRDTQSPAGAVAGTTGNRTFHGFNDTKLTEVEWERLCDTGCRVCDDPFSKDEHESVVWLSESMPICEECHQANQILVVDLMENKAS